MSATAYLSLLTLGLAAALTDPVRAYDGILGLNAMNPVELRMSGTNLANTNEGSGNTAWLMDMQPVPIITSMAPVMAVAGTNAGLAAAADTAGVGSEGLGVDTDTATSDLWSRIKLDKNPDVIGRNIGPGLLLPDISMIAGYNDNLTFTDSNNIGTFYLKALPHLSYVMSDKIRKYAIDYFLNAGYFEATGGKDNYVDNRIVASFDYNPTSRIFASAFAEIMNSHDPRGQGRAEGGTGATQNSLDEWHQWGLGGNFAYGASTARGRLEFDAAYLNKRYDTNRQFTFSRDLDDYAATGRFFYRVRPKTSLVFEGDATYHDYIRSPAGMPSLDGITASFLTGVTWQATYKTTGFAKIGYNIRTFNSGQLKDQGGFSWNMGVDWKPKSYSTVHLESSQSIAESNGTGDAVSQSTILASWQHYWRDRFSTRLDLGYQNSTFDESSRDDNSYLLGARADYAFRRWMNLGAGYRHASNDSSDDVFGYDQNIFEINVDIVF